MGQTTLGRQERSLTGRPKRLLWRKAERKQIRSKPVPEPERAESERLEEGGIPPKARPSRGGQPAFSRENPEAQRRAVKA